MSDNEACGVIFQEMDGVRFKMREPFNFGFLAKYGRVFKVFDDQDSGNICFGVESPQGSRFVKFAGARTAEYDGEPYDAVARLRDTLPIYRDIRHDALINYLGAEEIEGGFAMVFEWADGECMGRMYEQSHRAIMGLPVKEKLAMFDTIIDFLAAVVAAGYVAIDFYDGSVMYDRTRRKTTVCDIDLFRRRPAKNDMGRMWGSSRFMSPEEYEFGATLDEVTNVFTIGQMGFSLFTDSDRERESWVLSDGSYDVLMKAISENRADRYASIAEFWDAWRREAAYVSN